MELVDGDIIRTTALFDGGSDGGCQSTELTSSIELVPLEPIYTTDDTGTKRWVYVDEQNRA